MTTEWQEESLLAVIHADGNNMGVKIQQKLNGSIVYARNFLHVDPPRGRINAFYSKMRRNARKSYPFRAERIASDSCFR